MADDPKVYTRLVVLKQDDDATPTGLLSSNLAEEEDEFRQLYGSRKDGPEILPPPYEPWQLEWAVEHNNALWPCIDALIQNVDGTGAEIIPVDPTLTKDKIEKNAGLLAKIKKIESIFNEISPGKSFATVRKDLRRDAEVLGNWYLEVIRSLDGQMKFLRQASARMIRLVRLDDPTFVEKEIFRAGKKEVVKLWSRQRRYVQLVGEKEIYFKEYGSQRPLNKFTGHWHDDDSGLPPLKPEEEASELIHGVTRNWPGTPYGIPRWSHDMPSVIGSRKAEEQNLEFFNSGGVPPLLAIVQGGQLAEEATEALERLFTGTSASKLKGAVLEAHSTSGSIDQANNVRVNIERFGSERQSDSMFEMYDEKCEKRIRSAFRLPPIMVGRTDDYSFASAHASYTVAEAQVFKMERAEFDELINNTVMAELNPERDLQYHSLPLTVNHTELQLAALGQAVSHTDTKSYFENINRVANLELKPSEQALDPKIGMGDQNQSFDFNRPKVPTFKPGEKRRNVPEGSEPNRTRNTRPGSPDVQKED